MLNYFVRQEPRGKHEAIKVKQIPHLTSPDRISQLNFSFNDIRVIPPHITSAKNLQMLDLSHNKISKIEYVSRISSLKFINLSYNLISEVPADMLQLVEIQNIDLSFNKIAILNNIKVLKQLVEMRTFEKKGFIEINLQGNQILKKKGCKEIYKKWMNPSYEQYKKQSRKQPSNDCYIHLTKKRNSKSLQMPLKDASMIPTHRSHMISQKMEETKVIEYKNKKVDQKSGSAMKNSIQMTQKLSPNLINSVERSDIKENRLIVKSEILSGVQNFQDLSKVFQSTTIQDLSNLGEWFCACIDELNDLAQKFSLLTSNEDINALKSDIKLKLEDESEQARQITFICLEIVKQAIQNKLNKHNEQNFLKQILAIDIKIKAHHDIILKEIGNCAEALPIKLYKVWVALYRRLKSIIYLLPQKIAIHRVNYARELQIQELLSISPDKNSKFIIPSHEKRQLTHKNQSNQKLSASKGKLEQLLFSRNKSQCLLLSDNKDARASSQKKSPNRIDKDECENCMMLKWVNNKNKDEITQLADKVENLQRQKLDHLQIINNLGKFKEKYLNLASKQELIIGQLEYLKPSTYQTFLLEQAKTIQYMLHTSDLIDYQKLSIKSKQNVQTLQQYTSKQIQREKDMLLNTRLSSTNNNIKINSNHNKVSEFSINGKQEMITKESNNTIRGSSYFKNKNIITTVNRTNEDPKTQIVEQYLASEENKPRIQQHRQEIVVSQFNSHVNSLENTSNKNKNITFQQFSTQKDNSKELNIKNNRKITQKSSKMQNDIILISEGSQLKKVSLQKLQTLKLDRNENKNMLEYLKSEQFNQILRQKLKDGNEKSKSFGIVRQHSLKQTHHTKNANQRKNSSQKHPYRITSELSYKQNMRSENLKRNKTVQRFYHDAPSQNSFLPMESTEAENYKKYIKYHLRNNIIEILFKKNNCGIEQNYQDRYNHYTKNQKLISKKDITQRSQMEEGLSKRNQINKTFR